MRGSRIAVVVLALVSVVVLAVVASSGSVRYADRWPSLPWTGSGGDVVAEASLEPTVTTPVENVLEGEEDSTQVGDVFGIILIGLAALAAAVMFDRRRGSRTRWQQPRERHDFQLLRDRLDEVSMAVEDDAAAQRDILLAGEPRNAIVECWQRVEELLVERGIERQPSDTSTDLVVRALGRTGVGRTDLDGEGLMSFAALYREARFSSHPIGEAERRAALASLDAVHAALRARHSSGTISMT